MKGQEDLELAAAREHTRITTIYRITIEEKDQSLHEYIVQLKAYRRNHKDVLVF